MRLMSVPLTLTTFTWRQRLKSKLHDFTSNSNQRLAHHVKEARSIDSIGKIGQPMD